MKRQAPATSTDKREPKLVLHRESIRELGDDKLEAVAGGGNDGPIRIFTIRTSVP